MTFHINRATNLIEANSVLNHALAGIDEEEQKAMDDRETLAFQAFSDEYSQCISDEDRADVLARCYDELLRSNHQYNTLLERDRMCALPPELLAHAFAFLDHKSLGRAAQVCSLFNGIINSDAVKGSNKNEYIRQRILPADFEYTIKDLYDLFQTLLTKFKSDSRDVDGVQVKALNVLEKSLEKVFKDEKIMRGAKGWETPLTEQLKKIAKKAIADSLEESGVSVYDLGRIQEDAKDKLREIFESIFAESFFDINEIKNQIDAKLTLQGAQKLIFSMELNKLFTNLTTERIGPQISAEDDSDADADSEVEVAE